MLSPAGGGTLGLENSAQIMGLAEFPQQACGLPLPMFPVPNIGQLQADLRYQRVSPPFEDTPGEGPHWGEGREKVSNRQAKEADREGGKYLEGAKHCYKPSTLTLAASEAPPSSNKRRLDSDFFKLGEKESGRGGEGKQGCAAGRSKRSSVNGCVERKDGRKRVGAGAAAERRDAKDRIRSLIGFEQEINAAGGGLRKGKRAAGGLERN
eukprot:CAMPEP_0181296568 /NCGR_PEP_ID=MMETSP1101-20121128/4774_1 /TAXON_ID=46948 /ORGANISM="Rhodomonas abbreviata, Strain Caron Lab Isolate" /LENGTH=208 /DNA_ID=CAMNT_0023401443 /DNA_START=477 /DNA_END=1105 /DNA_ORIENTATION=-